MENLSHTLLGAVLSKAGLEKKTPLATPALLVAANLPDMDIVTGLLGKNYTDVHRGITHGAAGILVLSLGLSAALWLLVRTKLISADEPAKYIPLWYVSFLGLLTHPVLDYLNDYGLRPWLPFSKRKYYGDLVSIVDPWLWIVFGSSLFVLTISRQKKLAWMGLGLILATLITMGVGPALGFVWLGVLSMTVLGGRYLLRRGIHVARVSLLVFLIYLACIGVARERALQTTYAMGRVTLSEPVRKIDVLPARPGGLRGWTVVMEVEKGFYLGDVRVWDWQQHSPELHFYPKNWEDPCYQKARSNREMAALIRFARFPSVDVQSSRKSCIVFLRDLRYARRSMPGWGVARATVPLAD